MPVEDLAVDDIVLIKPGRRVPVDGVITAGESRIDQSSITGDHGRKRAGGTKAR